MTHKNINNSGLGYLTLGYFLLLIYASLMPYDFNFAIDLKQALSRALNHWPINPHARVSGSDLVSNLILYIPLGFLIATQLNSKWTSWVKCCFFAFIFCSFTSLTVETVQSVTLSRTASITDWFTNSISGFIGSYIGARYGQRFWNKSCDWIRARWDESPLDIFTLLFSALIAADALSPFLPTLLLTQLWHSFKRSQFNIITGFSQHPWHWWLINHIFIYMILMILAAHWGDQNRKRTNLLRIATICGLFAAMLEFSKLFIASRVMNLSDLLANWIGILLAFFILRFWRVKGHPDLKLDLSIVALVVYILYLGWTPFNFQYNPEMLAKKIPTWVEILPFYHYAMGASLNHIRLFLQTLLLSGTLIYFLRLRYPQLDNLQLRFALVLMITAVVGILQEGGQFFLPSRTPSMTDIYCYMIGGVIAMFLPRRQFKSDIEKTDSPPTRID